MFTVELTKKRIECSKPNWFKFNLKSTDKSLSYILGFECNTSLIRSFFVINVVNFKSLRTNNDFKISTYSVR